MSDLDTPYDDSEDDDWENDDLDYACNQLYNRSESLTVLNLSGHCIRQAGMKRLATSCCDPLSKKSTQRNVGPYQTHLVCLRLALNDLHPDAAQDLVRLIAVSPKLQFLYLNHNSLSNRGVELVANACFSQLQICDLEGNRIGVEGAQSLATNLKDTRCTITTLILNHNQLKDEGVKEIVEALKQNTTLKCLEVQFNGITQQGFNSLYEMLQNGENLTMETILFYEVQDYQCVLPHLPANQVIKVQFWQHDCPCVRCLMKSKIEYFLALNKAGRRSFSSVELPMGLWPTSLARLWFLSPALLYGTIRERPDIFIPTC